MIAALAPGSTSIGIPAAAAAATSRCPGSDTPGVPASLTSATWVPLLISATSSSTRLASFPSKNETTRGGLSP